MRREEVLVNVKKERISEVPTKTITISKVQSLAEEKQTKRSSSNSSIQEDAKKVKVSFHKLNLKFFFIFFISTFLQLVEQF